MRGRSQKTGSDPAFRRNEAERVYTTEAAHNPEVAGSNPAPATRGGLGNGAFSLGGQRIGAVAAGWQAGLILRPGKRTPRRRPTADLHRQRTWTRLPTS